MTAKQEAKALAQQIEVLTEKAKGQSIITMRSTLEKIASLQVRFNLLMVGE